MAIDPRKNRNEDIQEITQSIVKALMSSGIDIKENAEEAASQIGEGFERGIEGAAERIVASSVKITKAFRDLAKKITNQKDIFNISLGGKDIIVDIDFSDVDINSEDFQKKINETFEKIKIENAIEFDSKASEKQFKNMLGLYTKYAFKLSKLQEQRPKLTNQDNIKTNAKEQLAVIDGLKEVQRILNQTSDISIELPHVYLGDVKELRTSIDLIEQLEKGEEKIGKQRDANYKRRQKENKKLKETIKLYEEQYGTIEEDVSAKPKNQRTKKIQNGKEITDVVFVRAQKAIEDAVEVADTAPKDNVFKQLQKDAEAASKAFGEAEQKLYDIYEAEKKLDEQIKNAGLVDYTEKYVTAAEAREDALDSLRGGITKKSDHVVKERQIRDVINNLKDNGALSDEDLASIQRSALEYNLTVSGKYAKTTKEQMDQMFARIFEKIDKGTLKQLSEYRNLGMKQEAEQDVNGLIKQRRRLIKEHEAATKAYNDAADASSEAHKKLYAAEEGVAPEVWDEQNKTIEEQNAKLEERNRLINEWLEANKRVKAIEAKGYASPSDMPEEEFKVWSSAQEAMHEIGMRTDADDIMQGVREKIEKEFVEFGGQFDSLKNEFGDPNQWLVQYTLLLEQIGQGALTSAEAVAKLREEVAARVAEEARLAAEKTKSQAQSGTQQEIKSQEELQKKIEDTNQVIKNQKQWLEYLDSVLDEENFKTSGKRDATEQLKDKTLRLLDVRRHPEQYANLSDYEAKVELAQSQAYKEAERQGVANSTLRRYHTDAVLVHDQNIEKLQKERELHANILESAKNELAVLQHQSQVETKIGVQESANQATQQIDNSKFTKTINGKSGKFRAKKSNISEGVQITIDDIVPASADEAAPKIEDEAKALDKVGAAADKATGSKKKFAKANKEVAASVSPSVDKLETEADAMEDVGEAAKKVSKTVSKEFNSVAKDTKFSTRDYEKLYDEMESFAAQRRAENGYDLSKVTVNTDAHGNPLGATIAYYKKATKESIVETFKLDKAAQETEDSVNRLVLSSRKATAGIADFEKATLQAINRQDQLIAQKNKTVSSLSAVLDPNSNRSLAGTDYEEEANRRIQAIKDEVAKLDQVDSVGERIILPEKDFLAIKRRIAELTQDARDFINASKNAEYAPTQLESHSVSSGNQYRADQLKAQIEDWKRAGIYVGDLKTKADELAQSVTKITKHEDLKKYLEGMKEARALAKLSVQDKKAEEERQKALNKEYEEYITLIEKRDAIEAKMIGLDPEKNGDELTALRADYDAIDNEFNSKYGDFLSRKDVQDHFTVAELTRADDAARRKMAVKKGKISDKKRLEEEAVAQKKVNEAYREYVRLIQERGRASVKLTGLDPEKNKAEIEGLTAYINEIDGKLNETYGELLSNHVAQATLTLEDFMKYYDKWQQKLADKEAKAADKARNKEEKPYRDYGKTTANSAVRKRDNIQGEIDALGVTNPEILAQMDDYKTKVQEIVDIRAKFAGDPEAAKDPELVKQFQKASAEAERTRRGIKAVIDEEQKMAQMSIEQGFDPMELSADQLSNLKDEMAAFARAGAQGRVEIKGWNDDNTKMYYTVTDSKGAVSEMTAALGQGTNQLYKYRTATKETGTLIQQVFKGIKVKAKELLSFVIGGGSVYKVIELLRQGIQYVREIDLALTELKKVTSETEETYDKFLETASKTAEKVGSTIKDVVSSTADWARLNI